MTFPRVTLSRRLRARRLPLALLGLALVVPTLGYVASPEANAAVRPRPPVALFVEDFETGNDKPVSLSAYVGEAPQRERYTADRAWLTHCNGTVVTPPPENDNFPHSRSNGCVPLAYANALQLSRALGRIGAISPDGLNDALTARTDQPGGGFDPGAGKVQLETVDQVPISRLTNRFVGVGALSAAMNCGRSGYRPALLDFRLKTGATGQTVVRHLGDPRDVCTTPLAITEGGINGKFGPTSSPIAVRLGPVYSSSAYLFSGTRVGMQIVNAEASGTGNDVALDEISIYDMTPRLSATFETDQVANGGLMELSLTVVNSTDRGEKDGFGYSVVLPAGLEVAADPSYENFCLDRGNTGIVAGATRFTVKGMILSDTYSCVLRLQVRATSTGTKVLAPGTGITSLVGIDPSDPATLTVS